MNIYFACSITGGREFEPVYQALTEALMADGHPDIAVREISGEAYADLTENDTTVHAAYSRFALAPAVNLVVTPGEPENK